MTFTEKLHAAARKNGSWLCVGLDLDPEKLPDALRARPDGLEDRAKEIIDATRDLVCAYKPNIAFFEALGIPGLRSLERIIRAVPSDIPVILDAKRADIGNTSARYAAAAFDRFGADAVTANPYMGFDSLEPFFNYAGKHTFVLVLTSNPGAGDFEQLRIAGKPLYMKVAEKIRKWNTAGNIGAVVGATKPDGIKRVRLALKDEIFLIPGLGTQGGDAEKSVRFAFRGKGVGIFNVSRDIIFAPGQAEMTARAKAHRDAINSFLPTDAD
jgi:orotidine-5'-phosphate decarboxylase